MDNNVIAKEIDGIDNENYVKKDEIVTIVEPNSVYKLERSDYNGKHYYKIVVENKSGKTYKLPVYFKDRSMIFDNNTLIRIKRAREDFYHKGYDEIYYLLILDFDLITKTSQGYINEYNELAQQNKQLDILKDIKTPYDDIDF